MLWEISSFISLVVFKEMELPFLGREKLKMIVGFEVEPFLPFPYSDAIVDFTTLREDKEKQNSKILVVAVRKSDVDHVVHYFEKADLSLNALTVDVFSFYEMYKKSLYKLCCSSLGTM